MLRKRKASHSSGSQMWDAMPWKSVAVDHNDLGEFQDAVFFGLEELDGNAYIYNKSNSGYSVKPCEKPVVVEKETVSQEKKTNKRVSLKELRKQNKASDKPCESNDTSSSQSNDLTEAAQDIEYAAYSPESWGKVNLHGLLVQALVKLGFQTPTPIQQQAIPMIQRGKHDLIGAAETGSGKTLAFCLPVLDHMLNCIQSNRAEYSDIEQRSRCPRALIIAPTRELALQITAVLKEVCNAMQSIDLPWFPAKINVVAVVGGMAEQKQRRLLSIRSPFVDIIVGTPGRLCELVQDDEIVVFQDMSRLQYLIVDEADRIVEEGHFPELTRLFNRIRDHEKLQEKGLVPMLENAKKRIGTFEDDYVTYPGAKAPAAQVQSGPENLEQDEESGEGEQEGGEEDDANDEMMKELSELTIPNFERMPTQEEIENARLRPPVECEDADDLVDSEKGVEVDSAPSVSQSKKRKALDIETANTKKYMSNRQTLLFSATAINNQLAKGKTEVKDKDQKKKKKTDSQYSRLPTHMQQLLKTVGIKGNIHIVDVTGVSLSDQANQPKSDQKSIADDDEDKEELDKLLREVESIGMKLPKTLTQTEIRCPTEDKDVYAYYFLLKNPGRTLLFVNSIKTARRVDGLLRALGINSRAIHAQLQQKQRLKALEAYRSSTNAVLVATDVAARGLDISMINAVLHYDVARSPQVYVHRSGRTARAGATGTSVSLVAPDDNVHHVAICEAQSLKALPLHKVELVSLPLLRSRVKLAKKIFTQSFVASQDMKQQNWLLDTAKAAELSLDEDMINEVGDEEVRQKKQQEQKKALAKAQGELRELLSEPVPGIELASRPKSSTGKDLGFQKQFDRGLTSNSGLKRKGGMIVFAK